MKDYVTGVKPIDIKHSTMIFSKNKRSHKRLHNDYIDRQILQSEKALSEYQDLRDAEYASERASLTRVAKRKFAIERTIDLHGLTKIEALEEIMRFFAKCHADNIRNVLIVTGGSSLRRSKIRSAFGRWMEEYFSSYVSSYSTARIQHGGDGAFYVVLKKAE
jgi:DNA-nicking Smr family endonuclease